MGNICKRKSSSTSSTGELEVNQVIRQSEFNNVLNYYDECLTNTSRTCGLTTMNLFFKQNKLSFIDKLVLDTLNVIKQLFDYDREVPSSMIKLQVLADMEKGWINVINSMINVIPLKECLGPSIINLLCEGFSLPTKESILKLPEILATIEQTCTKLAFNKSKCGCKRSNLLKYKCTNKDCIKINIGYAKHRNYCVVLSCLADKLAGPNSVILLTDSILNYLISNLNPNYEPTIILFSLIALEKFAQTNENKRKIQQILETKTDILFSLEEWFYDENLVKHQVGFQISYCLDNLFIFDQRKFSYENVDNSKLNAILNVNDACEYLKISADGVYARCDASLFESVRSTFQIDEGIWFYEVTLITSGVMQIGFATKNSKFLSDEGSGIGDDIYSIAYDGCRQVVWYNSKSKSLPKNHHRCWSPSDTLGCLIDLVNYRVIFYLNGIPLPPLNDVFKYARSGFFAAASFMCFQECKFNFGSEEFRYPPMNIDFKSFNDYGHLEDEDRKILPKFQRRNLIQFNTKENSCTLCYDNQATICLRPCNHSQFCSNCALQLEFCPLCRIKIEELVEMKDEETNNKITTNEIKELDSIIS